MANSKPTTECGSLNHDACLFVLACYFTLVEHLPISFSRRASYGIHILWFKVIITSPSSESVYYSDLCSEINKRLLTKPWASSKILTFNVGLSEFKR